MENNNDLNMFGGLNTDGLEKAQDVLGGGRILETNVYAGTIKVIYGITARSGAKGVAFEVELENGQRYNETVYITNKKGDTFYTPQGSTKKVPLPGFTTANDIMLATTGKGLAEQGANGVEIRKVKIWDSQARAEIPTDVPVLVGALGQKIKLAINKVRENKNVDDGNGNFIPSNEERFLNNVAKVFHYDSDRTIVEILDKKDTAEFQGEWLKKNQDKLVDKFKPVSGNGGTGRPQAAASTGSAGGQNSGSIFE